uniref:Phosphoinositide 3-kinase regulatory subunit 5 n=1 Tax=Mola mola TaxID=94237 RepID=A0A3Q4AZ82_MOLML
MEQSSCTEDRIQHVLERCLCGLGLDSPDQQLWNAGLCMNRWCLEELVKRDPQNFLILLQKVLRKTKQQCCYELVVPLTLLFSSALLRAPHVDPDCSVLQEAYQLFHGFLTWPEPCFSASKRLLKIIEQELRAPGSTCFLFCPCSPVPQTYMVLLVSPDEDIPLEVQSVSEQLNRTQLSSRDVAILLILHCFQAALGPDHNRQALHTALQKLMEVLTDIMETAASTTDLSTARQALLHGMERLRESIAAPLPPDGHQETGTTEGTNTLIYKIQLKPRKKPKKKSRSLLGVERFPLFFKNPLSPNLCRHAQSVGYRGDFSKDQQKSGSQLKNYRSRCRKFHPLHVSTVPLVPLSPKKHMCIRRRPILSCDEISLEEAPTIVKVVVFGGDREAGRLARAYCDLQQKESKCPRLTKTCKLQFYFVPTKRRTTRSQGGGHTPTEAKQESQGVKELNGSVLEESTTDIAQMLGVIDPWYERNVLSLLSLTPHVLCQVCSILRDDAGSGSADRMPLLTDMVLYYCRYADQPVLMQLYQAELTLAGGERRSEVFIHSLELGHTAGTRAVKAMGAAIKRFGIDEEREAVPLKLSVAYNKVAVSGRSHWNHTDIVCTSVNLYKACRKPEQRDSRIESLQLSMAEVLKPQCSRSKKSYKQHISMSEVKVDKVQVNSGEDGTTFAVCLDQDEKKFIQKVTRCEVSLCCKPGGISDWRSYKPSSGQVQPLHLSYCSLLCLPITSFSASCP